MDWLNPWWSTENQNSDFHDGFKSELESEVGPDHPLRGIETRLEARGDGDDALFELLDGTGRYAVVHLTWARHPESLPWPVTELYNSLEAFVFQRMIPDHSRMET
jgi:hypothetical protein